VRGSPRDAHLSAINPIGTRRTPACGLETAACRAVVAGLPTANRLADLDLPDGELSIGDAATLDHGVAELP